MGIVVGGIISTLAIMSAGCFMTFMSGGTGARGLNYYFYGGPLGILGIVIGMGTLIAAWRDVRKRSVLLIVFTSAILFSWLLFTNLNFRQNIEIIFNANGLR